MGVLIRDKQRSEVVLRIFRMMRYLSVLMVSVSLCCSSYITYPLHTQLFPWRALQGPPRVVIDFADDDCSGGAATYPRAGSYCTQFYICSSGRSFLYTCNPGLRFDVNLGSCNWGVLVDARCNDKDDSMLAV